MVALKFQSMVAVSLDRLVAAVLPLPRDLKTALNNLYSIGQNAEETRYWCWMLDAMDAGDDDNLTFDNIPGFPFNSKAIQQRIADEAYSKRIQAKADEVTRKANAISRASQEAQTDFTNLLHCNIVET